VTYLTGKKADYQDRAAAKEALVLWLACAPQNEARESDLSSEGLLSAASK
jgi:hypothetical protein